MLRIGWKDVAKVFRENAEISKLLTASAIFVFKNELPPTYLCQEIILIANELKKYGITYSIDSKQNLILNI